MFLMCVVDVVYFLFFVFDSSCLVITSLMALLNYSERSVAKKDIHIVQFLNVFFCYNSKKKYILIKYVNIWQLSPQLTAISRIILKRFTFNICCRLDSKSLHFEIWMTATFIFQVSSIMFSIWDILISSRRPFIVDFFDV